MPNFSSLAGLEVLEKFVAEVPRLIPEVPWFLRVPSDYYV